MWSAAITVFIYALAIIVSAAPVRVSPPSAGSSHLLVSSPDAPVQGVDPQPRADAITYINRDFSLSEIGDPLVDLLPIPDREKLALFSRTTASGPPSRREEEDIDPNAHVGLNARALGHLQNAGNPLVPLLGFTAPVSTSHVAAALPTTTSTTRPRPKSPRAPDGQNNSDNLINDDHLKDVGNPLLCSFVPRFCN